MRKVLTVVVAALATGLVAADASAQLSVSAGGRGGVAIPTGEFGDNADAAPFFGATLAVHVTPQVAVYAGYSRAEFNLKAPAAEATDAGFELGAQVGLPGFGFSPFVKAGVLFHDFEIQQTGVENEGDDELGFEVGAGAELPLGRRVAIVPGVGYRRYATEFFNQGDRSISYVNLDLGLRIRF